VAVGAFRAVAAGVREDMGRRNKRKVPRDVRAHVFAHDDWRCVYCGAVDNLTVDHKVPRSRGGTNHFANLQTLCEECNAVKDAHLV
jgi:5-methylcytosine-specific restriction endonuclease McrA